MGKVTFCLCTCWGIVLSSADCVVICHSMGKVILACVLAVGCSSHRMVFLSSAMGRVNLALMCSCWGMVFPSIACLAICCLSYHLWSWPSVSSFFNRQGHSCLRTCWGIVFPSAACVVISHLMGKVILACILAVW